MKTDHVLLLLALASLMGAAYAQDCQPSKQYDEGAYACTATAEVASDFDEEYATGVAESRMWSNAFAHCRKLGEAFEEELIPVPIAGSQNTLSEKLDDSRVRYSVSRAYYCGGI